MTPAVEKSMFLHQNHKWHLYKCLMSEEFICNKVVDDTRAHNEA